MRASRAFLKAIAALNQRTFRSLKRFWRDIQRTKRSGQVANIISHSKETAIRFFTNRMAVIACKERPSGKLCEGLRRKTQGMRCGKLFRIQYLYAEEQKIGG